MHTPERERAEQQAPMGLPALELCYQAKRTAASNPHCSHSDGNQQ